MQIRNLQTRFEAFERKL